METEVISPDEKVQVVIRQHWMSIMPITLTFVVIGVASIYGFYLLGRYSDSVNRIGPVSFAIIALLAVVVLDALLAYSSWWVYSQNRLIVTDKNLYQVTQNSLFSRAVSQFALERLQDVSAKQRGFAATLLDYGEVTAETAGEEDPFCFRMVSRPQKLAAFIMACHKQTLGGGPPPEL